MNGPRSPIEKAVADVHPDILRFVSCGGIRGGCDSYSRLMRLLDDQGKAAAAEADRSNVWVTKHFGQLLSFHMNLLDMDPKPDAHVDALRPVKTFNVNDLRPREKLSVTLKSLEILAILVGAVKQSVLHSFWFAFLPGAGAISPYGRSLFDLVGSDRREVRLAALDVAQSYFRDGSSTYLLLANFRCGNIASFIPICYRFAVSLRSAVTLVCDSFDASPHDPDACRAVAKMLVTLLQQVPFHRLEGGAVTVVCDRVLRISRDANPVVQIAVLQVCLALLSLKTEANEEVKKVFGDLFALFAGRIVPDAEIERRFGPRRSGDIDANICYFAVQCLGKMAELDPRLFAARLDDAAFPLVAVVERVLLRNDPDASLALHLLRLVRTVGSCCCSSKLWRDFVRPETFDAVELMQRPAITAALCDCLAEVGEDAFRDLPDRRRWLCITYLLTRCNDDPIAPENRVVTTAQVRAIGRLILWPSCNSDSAFVIDSAEMLLRVLGQTQKRRQQHKNVALSGSWSLANLAGILAGGDGEEDVNLEFPPHLTVELARVAVRHASDLGNLMNVRTSCVRALGCFVRCLDRISRDVDGVVDDPEFVRVCADVIATISTNVTSERAAMKVKWNACYASVNAIRPPLFIFDNDGQLRELRRRLMVDGLLPIVENFPNFKVRIGAAVALSHAASKDAFGAANFVEVCATVARGLDSVQDVHDEAEVRHRTELIDQLCLTFCHLLTLCDVDDLLRLNTQLLDDRSLDNLKLRLSATIARICPERGGVIVRAIAKLRRVEPEIVKAAAAAADDDDESVFDLFFTLEDQKHQFVVF